MKLITIYGKYRNYKSIEEDGRIIPQAEIFFRLFSKIELIERKLDKIIKLIRSTTGDDNID